MSSLIRFFCAILLLTMLVGCAAGPGRGGRPPKHPDTPVMMGDVMDMERPGVY